MGRVDLFLQLSVEYDVRLHYSLNTFNILIVELSFTVFFHCMQLVHELLHVVTIDHH